MKRPTIQKLVRVERAQERLAQAIDRLEAALNARAEVLNDVGTMHRQIDNVKSENRRLQQVNTEVSGRLDDAIYRIREIVGS